MIGKKYIFEAAERKHACAWRVEKNKKEGVRAGNGVEYTTDHSGCLTVGKCVSVCGCVGYIDSNVGRRGRQQAS